MSGYGWNQCGNVQPGYCGGGSGYGSTFVLIVVLFILLIIVGTAFY
ncbi:YjcZ family sporulation protein [Metasolibacillus sp. FSL H7-0170]|nr:YjcZ family sporulation protein [Metasolibacillus fluoroglycofenilyticus]KYG90844.1 sporulation protein YjcZ [[Bacillus] sp. KCTC 13219]